MMPLLHVLFVSLLLSVGHCEQKILKVGGTMSQTGKFSYYWSHYTNGYQLWANNVNSFTCGDGLQGIAVGADCYSIELNIQDDNSIVATMNALYDELIANGTDVLLGPFSSGMTFEASTHINGRLPMVAIAACSESIYNRGIPHLYSITQPCFGYMTSTLRALKEAGARRFGIVYGENNVFAKSAALGANISITADDEMTSVMYDSYDDSDGWVGGPELVRRVNEVKELAPDVLITGGHSSPDLQLFMATLRGSGYTPNAAVNTLSINVDQLQGVQLESEYWVSSQLWASHLAWGCGQDVSRYFGCASDFKAAYETAFPGFSAGWEAAMGAAGGMAIQLAMENLDAELWATSPAQALDASMMALDQEIFWGHLRFNERGENVAKDLVVMQLQRGEDGVVVPVVVAPEPVKEADMIYPAPWAWRPACSSSHYTFDSTECVADSEAHEVAFRWIQPKECVDGVSLPDDFTVACTYVPSSSSTGTLVTAIALAGLGISLAFTLIVIAKRKDLRTSQPLFVNMFCLGGGVLSLYPLVAVGENTDGSCMLRPWVFHLGATLMFGSLFVKVHRVWRIFDNPNMRKVRFAASDVIKRILGLMLFDATLLACWTIVSPSKAVLKPYTLPGVGSLDRIECESEEALFAPLLGFSKFLLLVYGCFLSYKTRNTNEKYAESKHIMFAMYNITCFGGVLALISLSAIDDRKDQLLIETCGIAYSVIVAQCIVVIPKLISGGVSTVAATSASKSNASSATNTNNTPTSGGKVVVVVGGGEEY